MRYLRYTFSVHNDASAVVVTHTRDAISDRRPDAARRIVRVTSDVRVRRAG